VQQHDIHITSYLIGIEVTDIDN